MNLGRSQVSRIEGASLLMERAKLSWSEKNWQQQPLPLKKKQMLREFVPALNLIYLQASCAAFAFISSTFN